MVFFSFSLFLLLAALLGPARPACRAASPHPAPRNLTPTLSLFSDASASLSFAQARTHRFAPRTQPVLDLGASLAVNWLRFSLPPLGKSPSVLELDMPALEEARLFLPVVENGRPAWRKMAAGYRHPDAPRPLPARRVAFELPADLDLSRPAYLSLYTSMPHRTRVLLWTQKAFAAHSLEDTWFYGAVGGILLAMILYNFSLFFHLRDLSYLYYVLYIAFMLVWQFTGWGVLWLVPGLGGPLHWYLGMFLAPAGALFFAGAFGRAFLSLPGHLPRCNLVIKWLMAGTAAVAAAPLVGMDTLGPRFCQYGSMLFAITLIIAGVRRWLGGYTPARFFVISWTVLSLGALITGLRMSALVPRTFFTVNSMLLASAAEAILLSFALADRINRLKAQRERLADGLSRYKKLSDLDELTGLFNRRYLNQRLAREISLALQQSLDLSVIQLDLDHFKQYNDRHGHLEGDKVLRVLARLALGNLRAGDAACRYGGEEFTLILPGARAAQATEIAERIRQRLAVALFRPDGKETEQVTASFGVAHYQHGQSAADLLQRADQALYRAKKNGRNRVEIG